MELETLLAEGIAELGLTLEQTQLDNLLKYRELLARWNQTYNLTAIRDAEEMVKLHLLDSLAVAAYLPAGELLDIGTGGGLPGIPLALTHPEIRFTLLDSNSKKTRFLSYLLTQLPLQNVEVIHSRVELFRPKQRFDGVISRAFSSLLAFIELASPHCKPDGMLLAMKGKLPSDELVALPEGAELLQSLPLRVPGVGAERHLITIKPLTV